MDNVSSLEMASYVGKVPNRVNDVVTQATTG